MRENKYNHALRAKGEVTPDAHTNALLIKIHEVKSADSMA